MSTVRACDGADGVVASRAASRRLAGGGRQARRADGPRQRARRAAKPTSSPIACASSSAGRSSWCIASIAPPAAACCSPSIATPPRTLGQVLMSREVEKDYWAVCRGWPEASASSSTIRSTAVRASRRRSRRSPRFTRLATCELAMPSAGFETSRYALAVRAAADRALPPDPAPPQACVPSPDRRHQPRRRPPQPHTSACSACTACCCMRGGWRSPIRARARASSSPRRWMRNSRRRWRCSKASCHRGLTRRWPQPSGYCRREGNRCLPSASRGRGIRDDGCFACAAGPYNRRMLQITDSLAIPDDELVERFVRSSGPGGQNVNKVATAVELRFDIAGLAVAARTGTRTPAGQARSSASPTPASSCSMRSASAPRSATARTRASDWRPSSLPACTRRCLASRPSRAVRPRSAGSTTSANAVRSSARARNGTGIEPSRLDRRESKQR